MPLDVLKNSFWLLSPQGTICHAADATKNYIGWSAYREPDCWCWSFGTVQGQIRRLEPGRNPSSLYLWYFVLLIDLQRPFYVDLLENYYLADRQRELDLVLTTGLTWWYIIWQLPCGFSAIQTVLSYGRSCACGPALISWILPWRPFICSG